MPVGLFTTWIPSCGDELQPTKSWRAADEWLASVGRGLTQFRTRLYQGEKRIGPRQLPVDGYDAGSQTAYEFHGCYWHGHRCWLTAKKFTSAKADVDQRMSVVSSKMGRQAKRHGDLSQPALSRSQREEADAGPAPATRAGGHFLRGPRSGH